MAKHYYNDVDEYVCRWIENLCLEGLIPNGDVDGRSIADVSADDVRGYTQAHFFCGVAGWPLALKLAGYPEDRNVWTGSCPCQPFSAAGAGAGFDDERHLWPHFYRLIRECRPAEVYGEQVASKAVDAWIDLVLADLEAVGYAGGAIAFPSAGVGAPHIRDRTYWTGYANDARPQGHAGHDGAARREGPQRSTAAAGVSVRLADSARERLDEAGQRLAQARRDGAAGDGSARRLGDTDVESGERRAGSVSRAQAPQHGARVEVDGCEPDGFEHAGEGMGERPGATNGFWRDADWLACRDGKWRPVGPGTFPLAHGISARVGRLRAYGNAINPEQAAEFLRAAMECLP